WFNNSPKIDLRVNILQTTITEVETALINAGVTVTRIPGLPQGLRIASAGAITELPGYKQGWWVVQDASAQLVTHLLDPQPGETIIDACAAPGGKTTHIAELMTDKGRIIACDRATQRLKKVRENATRLQLQSIQIHAGDSRNLEQFANIAERVLLDAPCSGLGTLHKRPDIRWRNSFESIQEVISLQRQLLEQAATWVKANGILVYATCSLNLLENEKVIQSFLEQHPNWSIQSPTDMTFKNLVTPAGWIKIYPHRHNMDGFFMVRLVRDW
ncbi:MAG: 16S rRNA (cytosine(967)-C(5))-methyltransferase RsmB, partial [Waterburya sp.]